MRRTPRSPRRMAALLLVPATFLLGCWGIAAAFLQLAPPASPRPARLPREILARRTRTVLHAAEEDVAALEGWLQSRGVTTPLRAARLPGYGLSLVAGEAGVKAGDILLSIPVGLHISPSAVRSSPIGRALEGVVDDDSAFLSLGLLAEVAVGEASALSPYVRILPQWDEMQLPLLWPSSERSELLRGSYLGDATEQTRGALEEQWANIATVAQSQPELFPPATFNEKNWLWAQAIVLTRALPFGNELSLIPGLDLCNHLAGSNNTCSIGMQNADGGIEEVKEAAQLEIAGAEAMAVLSAGRDHAPGEQVFIDYDGGVGWRLAWEMMYTYGFVPGERLEEWLANGGRPVHFDGVSPNDPLKMQKQALLQALGTGEDAWQSIWHDVRPIEKTCRSMAPLLRLAHLSPEDGDGVVAQELKEWRAEPQKTWAMLQQPVSEANERKVAGQVLATCEEELAKLPPAEELVAASAPAASPGPPEIHAGLAARVLLGERMALEACIRVWKGAM